MAGGLSDEDLTALDVTIDKIGMGYYQWALLALCGFGWLADNMWLEAVTIALPRVQDHFDVSNSRIGWLSTSMFGGMMIGAVGWGNSSDVLGRRFAFNATLVLSAIFGFLVSIAPTYSLLCVSLFLLGTAIGGSIPTDGTLFLENVPKRKRYLLTMLSVFFSVGGVVAAVVAILVVPNNSCPERMSFLGDERRRVPCDVAKQNMGWKYLFFVLTIMTAFMFASRLFFFTLHESPRYLVHAGRPQEAVIVLQKIIRVNGNVLEIGLHDVDESLLSPQGLNRVPSDELRAEPANERASIFSTSSGHSPHPSYLYSAVDEDVESSQSTKRPDPKYSFSVAHTPELLKQTQSFLPPNIYSVINAWIEKSSILFTDRWRRTTLLVWGTWMFTSLAYTMFNVYFPKLVEMRLGTESGRSESREAVLWDVVVFTAGGMPGAIIGAYMVRSSLGKRSSLALVTFATAILCWLFTEVNTRTTVVITSMGISLTTTIMWAILYGMTPEMFVTEVRGTACGNASALNRVSGMIAPLIGGPLLSISTSLPVYASGIAFVLGAACASALPYESAVELEAAKATESRGEDQSSYSMLPGEESITEQT
ncbi:major facilitator superfamily domain-containing protein [Cantharellus anzutake]|uniref:major facilitator superfamily domain-containing protein n=1 Tax=Cantharellus anzutake TaxID=1750568 RepID=UPI001907A6ED|nr:major facilitator superfamily domain-containing protein [Cantharellus anzutake]KAF8339969.1 major facilitator superfamily domain-containing protein [Cantharellus anzutake]